jgi:hypothetical protein
MIFFVDEDYGAYESWIAELQLRNFEVTPLRSSTEAWDKLWNASRTDVTLVIIDVMLAVDDIDDPRYSRELTDDYLESGLRLLENLVAQNAEVFPRRAVLLTNTINDATLAAARRVSNQYEIELWDKREIMSPLDFGDRIEEAIDSTDEG